MLGIALESADFVFKTFLSILWNCFKENCVPNTPSWNCWLWCGFHLTGNVWLLLSFYGSTGLPHIKEFVVKDIPQSWTLYNRTLWYANKLCSSSVSRITVFEKRYDLIIRCNPWLIFSRSARLITCLEAKFKAINSVQCIFISFMPIKHCKSNKYSN